MPRGFAELPTARQKLGSGRAGNLWAWGGQQARKIRCPAHPAPQGAGGQQDCCAHTAPTHRLLPSATRGHAPAPHGCRHRLVLPQQAAGGHQQPPFCWQANPPASCPKSRLTAASCLEVFQQHGADPTQKQTRLLVDLTAPRGSDNAG